MPTLVYRHDGPTWKMESGAGLSHSRDSTQSGDHGFFSTTSSRRTGATMNFDDVNVTDVGVDFEKYGLATPEHARFQQRERYGALWTFGVKGTY